MIGIVIPAHNEAATLHACLSSIAQAAAHPALLGEIVQVAVVLDGCSDDSAAIAAHFDVASLVSDARNVGRARAMGAEYLLDRQARWLAFTDADSVVSTTWLVEQLALASDAVCGTVVVEDWAGLEPAVQHAYDARYQQAEHHRHIHGANLGVSADAYRRAGGFAPLVAHEDVALVHALQACGARIAWSARPGVRTSARTVGRAPEGFAVYLRTLQAQVSGAVMNLNGVSGLSVCTVTQMPVPISKVISPC